MKNKMKAILITSAVMFIGLSRSTASAAPNVSLNSQDGKIQMSVSLDRSNKFTERLIDVLTKSPEVKEAVNMYTTPGTIYVGDGFVLDISQETIAQLRLTMHNSERFSVSGLVASFSGSSGVSVALRKAILASTSNDVIKQNTPGRRIGSGPGEVAVLEHETYGGNSFSCSPGYKNELVSHCQLNLVLKK